MGILGLNWYNQNETKMPNVCHAIRYEKLTIGKNTKERGKQKDKDRQSISLNDMTNVSGLGLHMFGCYLQLILPTTRYNV